MLNVEEWERVLGKFNKERWK